MKFWAIFDKSINADRLFVDDVKGRRAAAVFASTMNIKPQLVDLKDDPFENEDNVEYFIDTDDNSLVH